MSEAASSAGSLANLPEFSVTELSAALKRTVEETFALVRVRGEISGLKFHSSGHVYFDLKDDKAVLNAVIWRPSVPRLKLRPESGMDVVVVGRLSTYAGSSRYQILVEQIELAGLGALMALLEERRRKLTSEGLLDVTRKKRLPFLPEVIGVVTSPTGAVIRDIMHRLNARFPRRVVLWPVAVQGEQAAGQIVAAINGLNTASKIFPKPDLIIVARGGGSVEDLMAFNDEAVVRAVAASAIPVISAVGHETDTTLIDLAADIRAPTPTAAAELAVPVRTELLSQTLDFQRRMLNSFSRSVEQRRKILSHLARVLPRPDQLFAAPRQRLDVAGDKLGRVLGLNLSRHRVRFQNAAVLVRDGILRRHILLSREHIETLAKRVRRAELAHIAKMRQHLDALARVLASVSYYGVLERGFALVRGEDGQIRRRAGEVRSGETLTLTYADGQVPVVAIGGSPVRLSKKKSPNDQGNLF